MKLSRVAELTSGELHGDDLEFSRVSIDSRKTREGDLFVAIRGERFDGHDYLAKASDNGACAAMSERVTDSFASYVTVADARHGLGKLAAGWADQYAIRRLAVTGNAGKTTVKEMMAVMLGEQTLATQGNFNNDIGVPLTLLGLTDRHRYGVFELGANAPGEIAWTVSLVRPEVALITNVTGAHLEGFGSMQGIADAKAEIFSAVAQGGLAIINADDSFAEFFASMAQQHGLRTQSVSQQGDADWQASQISLSADGCEFMLSHDGQTLPVRVPLPGRHQVGNALLAIAAVAGVGIDINIAAQRLQQLKPVPGRMNVQQLGGGTLVDDAYNANPGSVRVAVDLLIGLPAPRLLVLGEIGELGPTGPQLHFELGEYARDAGIDALIAVGEASPAARGFGDAAQCLDQAAAAEEARRVLAAGGSVLVKGSRSAAMDRVVEMLGNQRGDH